MNQTVDSVDSTWPQPMHRLTAKAVLGLVCLYVGVPHSSPNESASKDTPLDKTGEKVESCEENFLCFYIQSFF